MPLADVDHPDAKHSSRHALFVRDIESARVRPVGPVAFGYFPSCQPVRCQV